VAAPSQLCLEEEGGEEVGGEEEEEGGDVRGALASPPVRGSRSRSSIFYILYSRIN